MLKFFLILLVIFGAALYFPKSRPVVMNAIQPALDPPFRWSTNGQMDRIARDLTTSDRTSQNFPETQAQFERWLDRRFQADNVRRDSWGTPYRIDTARGSFTLTSAGADREFGTEDDLVTEGERIVRTRR